MPALRQWIAGLWAGILVFTVSCGGVEMELPVSIAAPDRPEGARGGAAVMDQVASLPLAEREAVLVREVLAGNVPTWLRQWHTVELPGPDAPRVTVWVLSDYLTVGSDEDFVLIPLTPASAQKIADAWSALLPTPRIVDAVWAQADVRLGNDSIPPSAAMTSIPVFRDHDARVRTRRARRAVSPGVLTAGHKKDVVLTPEVADRPDRVFIYGWHRPTGDPIQPLYGGHDDSWVDYSHGIRLVSRWAEVDGRRVDLEELLGQPAYAPLFSDRGPLAVTRYRVDRGGDATK
ncbi:MAG: hypothetical protein AAF389_08940 [Gemmatimonadota bacterium]